MRDAGQSVLVLDSDATRRSRVTRLLAGWGYQVMEAGSIAEALKACASERPAVLLLAQRVRDGRAQDLLASLGSRSRPFIVLHGPWDPKDQPPRPAGVDRQLRSGELEQRLAQVLAHGLPTPRPCRLEDLRPGDHLLCLFPDRREQLDTLAAFFACGFAERERGVALLEDQEAVSEARHHFERAELPIVAGERTGSFRFIRHDESYFLGGRFEPSLMLGFLADLVTSALNDGYRGLRLAGAGSRSAETPEDEDSWFDYEERSNQVLLGQPITGMCCYSLGNLAPTTILQAIRTHPVVVWKRRVHLNPFYGQPLRLGGYREPTIELARRIEEIRAHPRVA